jgi:hypothetical protein
MRAEFNQDKVDKILQEESGGIPTAEIKISEAPNLVKYLDQCWEEARKAKEDHAEPQILANMKQIDGSYDATKLSAIKEIGGSEVFMMITDAKCKNAATWVEELLFQPNVTPWDVSPTPIPELPDYAMQEIYKEAMGEIMGAIKMEAQATGMVVTPQTIMSQLQRAIPKIQEQMKDIVYEKAHKMAKAISAEIDDKLIEGGWYSALKTSLPNIIMHTGFITGPIPKKRPSIKIRPMYDGKLEAYIVEDIIPTWESRHPLNLYPSPDSTKINDGYLWDRIKLTPIAIQELIGVPNYEEDEIRAVLAEIEEGKLKEWLSVDQDKADIDDTPTLLSYDSKKVDSLKFMGAVKGSDLLTWGKIKGPDGKKVDEDMYYNIIAYKIGSHIISIQYNTDPLGRKPYYKDSFEEVDGSFWGKGLPQIISDVQGICNAAARAIVNNASIACLTGDSIVYRDSQHRVCSEITLLDLWKRKEDKRLRRPIKLRCLNTDTGEIIKNEIVDIYNNGVADIYEMITLKGYHIKATGTHRFWNGDGEWQELDDFEVGDVVAVNGQKDKPTCIDCGKETKGKGLRCKSCSGKITQSFPGQLPKICIECGAPTARRGVKCRKCASRLENSTWNKKQIEISKTNYNASETTARMRYDCQSKKKDFCEICGERKTDNDVLRFEVHHCDRNPLNNMDDNLKTLCTSCHHGLHSKEDSFGDAYLHRYMSYDTIISIEYIGKENVYNLQMKAPYHNFVSNGFHCKNSGPQVERNIDRISPAMRADNRLIPWKVWDVTSDMMAGPAPALKFYQPPMVVDQLMKVYSQFSRIADEHSGVPAFAHGDPNVQGAGNTASGLSMLMGSAARGIKAIIKSIDENIIKPSVERQYIWLIERKDYYGMVCDYQIVSGGTMAALAREQMAARRIEFMNATANPVDAQIMGMEGRKYVIEETAKSVNMSLEKYMPKRQEQLPAPVDPETGQPNFGQTGASAQTLDAAGAPVQGQDTRMFNQGG